jgi:uncharacterized protein YkwD
MRLLLFILGLLFGFIGFTLLFEECPPCPQKEEPKIEKTDGAETDTERKKEFEYFKLANQERNKQLKWNECLAEVGRKKAKDMYDRNYFGHKDPLTGEIETWGWIKELCGSPSFSGENLTMNFSSVTEAHEALMKSPSHKENLQNTKFDYLGVGCYKNKCAQIFSSVFSSK